MALTPKALRPVDLRVVAILGDAVSASGLSHQAIAERAGMTQNRVSKILRAETPAPTIGELDAIADVLGLRVSTVINEAYAAKGPERGDLTGGEVDPLADVVRPGDIDLSPGSTASRAIAQPQPRAVLDQPTLRG